MNDELTPDERSAMRARIVGGARDIKPVGAHRGAVIAGSIAAVLVVAIAGGVAATTTLSAPDIATTPSPSATASVEQTPTSTPTPSVSPSPPRDVPLPTSRFSFGCDEVAETVRAYFDGAVPETVHSMPSLDGNAWTAGPMQYAFAQAGAVYCEFGDPAATWLTVSVVPDAEGAIEDRDLFNGGVCDPAYPPCELVGGSFILVEGLYEGAGPEDARPALDDAYSSMQDLVLSSPPSPAAWTPPAGTTPLTGDCAAFLPPDRLGQILGVEDLLVDPVGRGGWSLRSWLMSGYWEAPFCEAHQSGVNTYEDPFLTAIIGLPGGEWAYGEGATGDPLNATGGKNTDTAQLTCTEYEWGVGCRVDVLVDGSWLRISIPSGVEEGDRVAVATDITEEIFTRVYG